MRPTQIAALAWVAFFLVGQLEFWSITSRHIRNGELRAAETQVDALLWWPVVALIMAFVITKAVWLMTRDRY